MNSKRRTKRDRRAAEVEARVLRYGKIFRDIIDDHEKNNPEWRLDSLLYLVTVGLRNLRHYIDSSKERAIEWAHPFLQIHYPVDWDFAESSDGSISFHGKVNSGTLTADNTATRRKAVVTMAHILTRHLALFRLRDLTHDAAFQKNGAEHTPILPIEVCVQLDRIRSRRKRTLVLEELYEPFCMGAAPVDIDEAWLAKAGKVPRVLAERLAAANSRIHVPGIGFDFTIDGRPMRLTIIFQVYPMIVDVGIKQAYYPITVGLHVVPVASNGENVLTLFDEPWASPANWKRKDQATFWTMVFDMLKAARESLAEPSPSEITQAVLTVNAKFTVATNVADPSVAEKEIKQMLASFQGTGKLLEFTHQLHPSASVVDLNTLVVAVDAAQSAATKGAALEELSAGLFATVPGFEVTRRVTTATEEIDLVILNNNDDRRWKNDAPLIFAECKNWSSACGKDEVVLFRAKLEHRRNRCALGFLISWNGFAKTVTTELLRGSKDGLLIVPIDGTQIREAAVTSSFLPVLQRAWDQAVMT